MSNLKKELKKLLKSLPKGARLFVTFEGEQVNREEAERPGNDLLFVVDGHWRPEGEPLPPGVEVIPGYQRPVNWKELQARNATSPGAIELGGVIWKEPKP